MASFLRGATPIVRGRCDICGTSRNLWFGEITSEEPVPCSHSSRGCRGTYSIVYTGPKALMPPSLDNVRCACERTRDSQLYPFHLAGGDERFAKLVEMGFPEAASRQAIASCGGSGLDVAVEWLIGPGGERVVASAEASNMNVPEALNCHDVGECSICTDELVLADAAMRCAGHGGKQHYFHARCLTTWVRQCRSSGNGPTCPECRGPVQVRQQRLEEFLRSQGSALHAEDREAMRTFHDASETADASGWSNIRRDLWQAGAAVAIGAGIAVAIAAGIHAMSKRDNNRDSEGNR
mmetsp:Transcript_87570/g.246000  ORF Transcript_87570/g.246000 Transcript_87570/m.246000 type:complete len:294 (-) Transcript_87570:110-991(-)